MAPGHGPSIRELGQGCTVVKSSSGALLGRRKAGFWSYLFLMPAVSRDPPSFPLPPSLIAVEPSEDGSEESLPWFASELAGHSCCQCSCKVPQRAQMKLLVEASNPLKPCLMFC